MHIYCFAHTKPIINYLGIKFMKADWITIVHDKTTDDRFKRTILQQYLQNNSYKAINFREIDYASASSMQVFYKEIPEDALILLPPITQAKHINLYLNQPTEKIRTLFIESDGDIFSVEHNTIKEYLDDDVKLLVKDFIRQTKGKIISTNNDLFTHPVANQLLKYFIEHLSLLKDIMKYKKPLVKIVDTAYSSMNPFNNPYSALSISVLNKQEQDVYLGALTLLEAYGVIEINRDNPNWIVKFNDLSYRDYFAKTGTWLEHYTFNALKKIEGVRDVSSSVMFVWDDQYNAIRNELDVMAIADNKLITISCKDTAKIDDDYLYELESHATQLATTEAIKLIVTTAEPNPVISLRAKQLGITIITYDSIESHFLSDLQKAIF